MQASCWVWIVQDRKTQINALQEIQELQDKVTAMRSELGVACAKLAAGPSTQADFLVGLRCADCRT